jgi:hypothetical protein
VVLGVAQDVARRHGREVISETATPKVAARIEESVRRLTGARAGGSKPGVLGDTQTQLQSGVGLGAVIAVDEIHAVKAGDLTGLEALLKGGASLIVAGLPAEVARLLDNERAAFLRQAERIVLSNVEVADVEESFTRTFTAGGFEAPASLVRQAAEATAGYPFLIQLVGYFLWREAEGSGEITASTVARAIEKAQQRYARTIP